MLQRLDGVAGVDDNVALAAGARHRQQVMVEYEHAQVGRLGELLLDPAVSAAPDLPVVEVGLGGIHRHDRDAVETEHRVAVAKSSSKCT